MRPAAPSTNNAYATCPPPPSPPIPPRLPAPTHGAPALRCCGRLVRRRRRRPPCGGGRVRGRVPRCWLPRGRDVVTVSSSMVAAGAGVLDAVRAALTLRVRAPRLGLRPHRDRRPRPRLLSQRRVRDGGGGVFVQHGGGGVVLGGGPRELHVRHVPQRRSARDGGRGARDGSRGARDRRLQLARACDSAAGVARSGRGIRLSRLRPGLAAAGAPGRAACA